MNQNLNARVETLFMMPSAKYTFLSSSLVKEVFRLGGSVEGLVPPYVQDRLREKFRSKRESYP
jgi:pantetheine-phosphate adenylyltransferase